MIDRGGFQALNIPEGKPESYSFHYWTLNGGGEGGKTIEIKAEKGITVEAWIDQTHQGVESLLKAFANEDMPYWGTPIGERAIKTSHNDYTHLERIKEWRVQSDGGENA